MEHVGSRALIVEGGAMRGVFSCGILDHFLAADFLPSTAFGVYRLAQVILPLIWQKCRAET